jgi:pyrimidine deaminase RibD-like protein
MAAIVVRGGAILSVGVNRGWHHAEQRALKPHRNYVGATVVVARENGGISRPCAKCMEKLRAAGIAEVTYVDRERNTVTERVTKG